MVLRKELQVLNIITKGIGVVVLIRILQYERSYKNLGLRVLTYRESFDTLLHLKKIQGYEF